MLRTYSLRHDQADRLHPLLLAYRSLVNAIIGDIWSTVEWKERRVEGKMQRRLYPIYEESGIFKMGFRGRYLASWPYARHYVDSAIKVAYSIMRSWRKNYVKGGLEGEGSLS